MKRLWVVSACLAIFLIPGYSLHAEEGLLVHYDFKEGSGSVLRDSSGGGHDGAIEGDAKWVKGQPFGALDFNGANAYVQGPTDLPIDRVGSLEVWCYPRAVGGGLIAWCLGTQWNDQRLVLCFSTYKNNNLSGVISDGKTGVDLVQEPVPADMINRWSHMVMRFDEQNIQIFRNGKLLISKARFLLSDIKGVPMRIGLVDGLGVQYFDGMIAEARVYNRPLSDTEIAAHFAERAPVFQVSMDAAVEQPRKIEKAEAVQGQARKLEKAERITAVKGDGFFPVLIRLKNGTLAAVVKGGAPHIGVGGRVDLITSRDGGKTWSAPRLVVYMPPECNGWSFGQAADGRLICAWAVTGPYRGGQYVFESLRYTLWVTTSDESGDSWSPESGASWTPPRQIKTDPFPYASPFGKIITLSDGTLLMSLYVWHQPEREGGELPLEKRGYFAAVCRSTDNGATWSLPIPIVGYVPGRRENTNYSEIALVALPGDKVLAVMRGGPWDGLDQCISSDGGRTWGPIENIVRGRSPETREPGDVILLKSGRLLLTFGHRFPPFGVEAVLSRNGPGLWDQLAGPTPTPRPAAPVRTAGQWDWQTHVSLAWNAASVDSGYSSSVQLDDGTIVTLYYLVGELGGKLGDTKYGGLMPYTKCVRYQEADLLAGATGQGGRE